jgi:transcriptional regulator with XRE-family HTH domain
VTFVVKDHKRFGREVRERRVAKGWTQQQLGDKCGLTKTSISRIERGEAIPRGATVNKLAKVLEIALKRVSSQSLEDDLMEGLDSLDKKIEMMMEKVSGFERRLNEISQPRDVPRGSDDADTLSNSVASLIQGHKDTQDRLQAMEQRIGGDSDGEAEVIDLFSERDKAIQYLADKYEKAGRDVGFFGEFFDVKKVRNLKSKIYVDCYKVCEGQDVDPHEEIDGMDETETVDAMEETVLNFAKGKIDREKLNEDLNALLDGEKPESSHWWDD